MTLVSQRFPADLAGSGWYEILPPPAPAKTLESEINADWVIIGAGFAGLSAAKRIIDQSPGDKVVVIDAQRIAWGASGRNSGFVIDLPHNVQSEDYSGENNEDFRQIRQNRVAIDYVKSVINEFDLHQHASETGKINAATDQAGLVAMRTYSEHLQKLGEVFTPYDKTQLQQIVGTDYYQGGIHTPGSLLIQPAAYIRGLADGLRDRVEVFENSPVLKIETGDNKKVLTANGAVQAKNIILTVNGHLESFGLYKRHLMHVFLYGSMTRVLTTVEQQALGGAPEWGITPANPMGSTVRRTKDNRIVVRNHITYNPQMFNTEGQLARASKRHRNSFVNRFPMLPKVEMQHSWSGHLCLSRNSVQVFGEIEKGLYVACCHNGLGASKGTLGGMLIADMALEIDNPMVAELQSDKKPKKLFPEPFMTAGAKTHLWWGQRRAGKDV